MSTFMIWTLTEVFYRYPQWIIYSFIIFRSWRETCIIFWVIKLCREVLEGIYCFKDALLYWWYDQKEADKMEELIF